MPTDTATSTVVVPVPPAEVLETIRAVDGQTEWVPEIREAEILTRDAEGLAATARFAAATPVGTDRYTLRYDHRADGMDWHLVEGRLQTAQDASYDLVELEDASTEVTFTLTISHNLPLPGFIRRKVIGDLVNHTTTGLAEHLDGAGPG